MSPGVSFGGEVKAFKGRSRRETECEMRDQSPGLDPKTGDLSMGRVKRV